MSFIGFLCRGWDLLENFWISSFVHQVVLVRTSAPLYLPKDFRLAFFFFFLMYKLSCDVLHSVKPKPPQTLQTLSDSRFVEWRDTQWPRGGAKNPFLCHATKYFIHRLLCQDVTFFSQNPFSHCTEPYVTARIKFQPRMEMAVESEKEKLAASVDPHVHFVVNLQQSWLLIFL